jgi:uncharacterized protein (UPF0261 family)
MEVILTHRSAALLVATMDTKSQEALYIVDCIKKEGISVKIMDAGIRGTSPVPVDIRREKVALAGGKPLKDVQNIGHEGKALKIMTAGAVKCTRELYKQGKIHGVIGLGGSMGTTLGTAVMRSLDVGVPKVMISTMASRDTQAFVGTKDILMLHSVCDLAGLNRITKKVLRNGALAMAGMLRHTAGRDDSTDKPLVFISTLGTTEACAQNIRRTLEENGNEVIIFHTVGAGGKAMEEMIQQENTSVLIDLSLHEIADHMFGGDYDAGPGRGSVALDRKIPTILVPGNIDFLVTGPLESALKQFPNRPYHVHNAAITVVRTKHDEIKILAKTIAGLCNNAIGPVKILIPMNGFSAFDHKEGPLHDSKAPGIFVKTLEKNLDDKSCLNALPFYINDSEFAHEIIDIYHRLNPDIS